MIDRNQIVCVYDIEKSQLCPGWYNVECVLQRGVVLIKMRYPYRSKNAAKKMKKYLDKKSNYAVQPHARADVYIMNENVRSK